MENVDKLDQLLKAPGGDPKERIEEAIRLCVKMGVAFLRAGGKHLNYRIEGIGMVSIPTSGRSTSYANTWARLRRDLKTVVNKEQLKKLSTAPPTTNPPIRYGVNHKAFASDVLDGKVTETRAKTITEAFRPKQFFAVKPVVEITPKTDPEPPKVEVREEKPVEVEPVHEVHVSVTAAPPEIKPEPKPTVLPAIPPMSSSEQVRKMEVLAKGQKLINDAIQTQKNLIEAAKTAAQKITELEGMMTWLELCPSTDMIETFLRSPDVINRLHGYNTSPLKSNLPGTDVVRQPAGTVVPAVPVSTAKTISGGKVTGPSIIPLNSGSHLRKPKYTPNHRSEYEPVIFDILLPVKEMMREDIIKAVVDRKYGAKASSVGGTLRNMYNAGVIERTRWGYYGLVRE